MQIGYYRDSDSAVRLRTLVNNAASVNTFQLVTSGPWFPLVSRQVRPAAEAFSRRFRQSAAATSNISGRT